MLIKTLRTKVLLYFIFASAIVISIYGFITYNMIRTNLENEMENRLITAGEIIAQTIVPGDMKYLKLKGKLYDSYRLKLKKLKDITEVRDILLIGPDRGIMLSTLESNEKFFLNLDHYEIEKAFEGENAASPLYKGAEGLYYKTGYVPVESSGEVLYVVAVEASVLYVRYLAQYKNLLLAIGLISFIIAAGLSILLSRGITRKLEALKKKAEQIAKRNFGENIEVGGEEEISVLADTLNSMKKELEDYIVNREKMATVGEFSAGVAHEIRNSLGAISGYAELIREKAGDEKIRKYSEDIVKNCHKMNEFLNNFLAYTKEFTPDMQEEEVSRMLDNVVEEMPKEARQVIVKRYDQHGARIKADFYLLKKAFYNIIINSWQALDKPHGNVELFIVRDGLKTVIIVKDNGKGMDSSMREKIFQPFFTGRKEGTGLGLAIAYRIIKEIHKGEIVVESEIGKGTEFKIIL
jgi:signal transduction histidine kinase